MKPINLPFFIGLGAALQHAGQADPEGKLIDAFFRYFNLRMELDKLLSDEHVKLSAAAHDLTELRSELVAFDRRHFRDTEGKWRTPPDDEDAEYEIRSIANKIDQFRTVLNADLRITASFNITRAGIFDVNLLVNSAHQALSSVAHSRLGAEVCAEIDSAGKCLAFDLPTACGFHAMRGVERVLKEYLARFFSKDEIGKMNNWGHYVANLEKKSTSEEEAKPSTEAVALLRQIKDIYRNPVIHPERSLNAEEAATLFHSTIAAINRLAIEMPEPEQPALPDLFAPITKALESANSTQDLADEAA